MAEPVKVHPGAAVLRYRKEEAYAQQRAYGHGLRESARRAGLNDYTGIQSKYELKLRVRNRIAYLRNDDLTNEYHQEKRRRLEERLDRAAFGNFFDYVIIDDAGKPRINWRALRDSDLAATISELRCDKETGVIINISRESALSAIAQIREMRGYKAAERHRIELSAIETMSDEELLRIAGQAAANVTTTPRGAMIEARRAAQDEDDTSAENENERD